MWPKIFKKLSDLPLSKGDYGFFIPWLVATLIFFAALSFHVSYQINQLVIKWEKGLNNAITVQVMLVDFQEVLTSELFNQKLEKKSQDVLMFLKKQPEIQKAYIISRKDILKMMTPWFGEDQIIAKEFMPTLMHIELYPHLTSSVPSSVHFLTKRLKENFDGVSLDAQNLWLKNLVYLGKNIQKISFFVLGIVLIIVIFMMIFLIKIGFLLHKKHVEMLSLMGASPSYITRQFMYYILFRVTQGIIYALVGVVLLYNQGFFFLKDHQNFFYSIVSPKEIAFLGGLIACLIVIISLTSFITLRTNIQRLP